MINPIFPSDPLVADRDNGDMSDRSFGTSPKTVQPLSAPNAEVRQFVGDGTGELSVPGLKKLIAVRIGSTDIPLLNIVTMPASPSYQDHIKERYSYPQPMFQLTGEKGLEVLRRCIGSNDGIWQDGEKIQIAGEWTAKKGE